MSDQQTKHYTSKDKHEMAPCNTHDHLLALASDKYTKLCAEKAMSRHVSDVDRATLLQELEAHVPKDLRKDLPKDLPKEVMHKALDNVIALSLMSRVPHKPIAKLLGVNTKGTYKLTRECDTIIKNFLQKIGAATSFHMMDMKIGQEIFYTSGADVVRNKHDMERLLRRAYNFQNIPHFQKYHNITPASWIGLFEEDEFVACVLSLAEPYQPPHLDWEDESDWEESREATRGPDDAPPKRQRTEDYN